MNSSEVLRVLDNIAETGSRNDKEEILGRCIDDPFMKEVLRWACDPFITFGITPPKVETTGHNTFDVESNLIWALLNGLRTRTISGGEAHDLVRTTMMVQNQNSAELLWRILSKDLRCGITAKTIGKMMPGLLPVFDVMLSHKYAEKRIKSFPVAMEPKLDGLRAICLVRDGTAQFYSRVGNRFPALDVAAPRVVELIAKAHKMAETYSNKTFYEWLGGESGPAIALEGEAISGMFAETSGAVRRKSEAATEVGYHMFDAIPFAIMIDSSQPGWAQSHSARRAFLDFILECSPRSEYLRIVPRRLAHSLEQIQSIYEEYRNTSLAAYLARGDEELLAQLLVKTTDESGVVKTLEGAIVKPLNAPYEKKRSYGWMKIKGEETEDLRAVDAFEGTGKYEGMLGGLVVDRSGVQVRVGGGFSDVQRKELWAQYLGDKIIGLVNPERLRVLGRLIEVEYHEVTPDGSLRHPRFVRFRNDKDEALRAA